MSAAALSPAAYWRLVRSNRDFRLLWSAQIVSELGDWIYAVAIYALLLEATGSARSVAIAVVLQVLPQVLVAPVAGALNDRISRKKIMISADLARAAIVLVMLFASRAGCIRAIYCLLFLETLMWAFFEPGRSATVPNIAGEGELVVANALSSATWSTTLALGSGLGGVAAAFAGRDAVFVLNSASFLLSAALLSRMRLKEQHIRRTQPAELRDLLLDLRPIAEGVRYIARRQRLIPLIVVKAALGFLGVQWVLMPIFGERVFPISSPGIDPARGAMLAMSFLMSARGVGALLGPLLSTQWTGERRRRLRLGIVIGFAMMAAGSCALAFAPNLGTAMATVVLANAGGSMVWVFATTLLQFYTSDEFRGRVFSLDFAFHVSAMAAASYTTGLAVDAGTGVRTIALLAGAAAAVACVWWLFVLRRWPRAAGAAPEAEQRAGSG